MLGDLRRLIVVHATIPASDRKSKTSSDQVLVFGCVGGQIKAVLNAPESCGSEAKVESATPDKVVITSYDPRTDKHPERLSYNPPYEYAEHGDPFFSYLPRPDKISCDRLKTIKADTLTGIRTGGCDQVDQNGRCEDEAPKVDTDRMIAGRRLIVVHGCSADHCEDGMYAFSCVSGRVKTVFDREFIGLEIDDLSNDKLVLSVAWDFGKGGLYTPSETNQITYVWNAEMQNYVLSSMHLSPFQQP